MRFSWLHDQFALAPRSLYFIQGRPLKVLVLPLLEYLAVQALDGLIRHRGDLQQCEGAFVELDLHSGTVEQGRCDRDVYVAVAIPVPTEQPL